MILKYIMVTGFEGHWDRIPNNETSYPYRMLKGDTSGEVLLNGTPTIFVKVDQSGLPIKAWNGRVEEIREAGSHIKFRVVLDSPIDNPGQYSNLQKGWYIERVEANAESEQLTSQVSDLQPPFFNDLLHTENWSDFEDYTYYLLRLLGIHAVYKIDRRRQRGKADGFFKFKGLAVIYDCTLEQEQREENKSQQIYNYCKQLETGMIELDGKVTETFSDHEKQVWLITRDNSKIIRRMNDIAVKEVNIVELIDVYEYRLRKMMTERDLEKRLMNIGQSLEL